MPGVGPSQALVFLPEDDDPLGAITRTGMRTWAAVTLPEQVRLEDAFSRLDAARDIVQYLADHKDDRLELDWREVVAWGQ